MAVTEGRRRAAAEVAIDGSLWDEAYVMLGRVSGRSAEDVRLLCTPIADRWARQHAPALREAWAWPILALVLGAYEMGVKDARERRLP